MKPQETKTTYTYNMRKQRIWAFVALGGLFTCGLFLGAIWFGGNVKYKGLAQKDCDTIARRITNAVDSSRFEDLEKWQKIYAKSCRGHIVAQEQKVNVTENKKLSTCERIEKLLSEDLKPEESTDFENHELNKKIYLNMMASGCPENRAKFEELVAREDSIIAALKKNYESMDYYMGVIPNAETMSPCQIIEQELKTKLEMNPASHMNAENHLRNAEVYSTLATKGCPENADKYRELALGQIEIASAVAERGEMEAQHNVESVVDTYKKLQMKAAAEDVLNKVRKISDPAIDFIIQMEKIINE